MADAEALAFLGEFEQEYGVEISSGGGSIPAGVYAGNFSDENEVRATKTGDLTGAPRVMVKVELTHPENMAGRKPTEFFGWFGKSAESTTTIRGMFFSTVKNIAESAPTIDMESLADACRMLPKGQAKKDYKAAEKAFEAFLAVIEGHSTVVKIVDSKKNPGETKMYFIDAAGKEAQALVDGDDEPEV